MTTWNTRPRRRLAARVVAITVGLVLGMTAAVVLGVDSAARADTIETKTRVVTWVIPGSTGAVTFPQYLPGHPSAAVGGACQVDTYNVSTPEQERALEAVLYDGVLDGAHEDGALYLSHVIHQPGVGDCPALPTEEPTSTPTPTSEPSATPTPTPGPTSAPSPTTSASPSVTATPPAASPSPTPTPTASPSPTASAAPVASPTPATPPLSAASSVSIPATSSATPSPSAPSSALPTRLAATGTGETVAAYGLGGLALILAGTALVRRRTVTR